jgi:hypothetical protein
MLDKAEPEPLPEDALRRAFDELQRSMLESTEAMDQFTNRLYRRTLQLRWLYQTIDFQSRLN